MAADSIGIVLLFDVLNVRWLGVTLAGLAVGLALFGFHEGRSPRTRLAVLGALVLLLLAIPQLFLIAAQPPDASIIDGAKLNDVAADRILSGHNPYVGDYVFTPMRAFFVSDVPVNFGLARFVYMPGMAELDLPLRLLHNNRVNFSWLYLPGLLALAAGAWAIGRTQVERELSLIVVALSPLFAADYFYLFNDLFFLAPALGGVAMLRRGRVGWAGALFGLSLAMKQQGVIFLPLVVLFAVGHLDRRQRLALAGSAAAVLAVTILPFLVWDPVAFVAGTTGFFYGSGGGSAPIRGVGLPGLLLRSGLIVNRWQPFPSAAIQAPLLLILLAVAARDLRRRWTWSRYWLYTALVATVLFVFGRVLAPNYLDLVVTLFLLAAASALAGEGPAGAIGGVVDGPSRGGREVVAPADHQLADLSTA